VLLQWNDASGQKRTTVDLTPNDVDANGWVWIRIEARPADKSGSLLGSFSDGTGALSTWRMMRFDPTLTGTVVASGPHPTQITWPVERPAAPQPAKKAEPKKPDPKKPEPKKADPKKPDPKQPAEKK
jgi:hypothetical protein